MRGGEACAGRQLWRAKRDGERQGEDIFILVSEQVAAALKTDANGDMTEHGIPRQLYALRLVRGMPVGLLIP